MRRAVTVSRGIGNTARAAGGSRAMSMHAVFPVAFGRSKACNQAISTIRLARDARQGEIRAGSEDGEAVPKLKKTFTLRLYRDKLARSKVRISANGSPQGDWLVEIQLEPETQPATEFPSKVVETRITADVLVPQERRHAAESVWASYPLYTCRAKTVETVNTCGHLLIDARHIPSASVPKRRQERGCAAPSARGCRRSRG